MLNRLWGLVWVLAGYISQGTLWFFQTQLSRNVLKRTFGYVRPAKIHISLRIWTVWSESSMGAFWIAKDATFFHADNKDCNQTARMSRLIWVFAARNVWRYVFSRCRSIVWLHICCMLSTCTDVFCPVAKFAELAQSLNVKCKYCKRDAVIKLFV